MKISWKKFLVLVLAMNLSFQVQAQDDIEEQLDEEVETAQPLELEYMAEPPSQVEEKKSQSSVDEEQKMQSQVIQRKRKSENEISSDPNLNRFPKQEPLFKRPPAPAQGGPVRVEHPRAAEGLLRVNKDGSYQYRTSLRDKSKSSSVKLGAMTPPKITVNDSSVTYETMYGSRDLLTLLYNYEWQPFRQFGSLGVFVETGFATVSARGSFKNQNRPDQRTTSEERYNFFIIPASVFVNYRFEYVRRQWVVPFVNAGATYYGLAEVRNDGKQPTFAGAPAVSGGGGLMFSISRLDSAGAFALSSEYGIADMWLTLEARASQGLYSETDFSGTSFNGGITVDF